MTTTKKYDYLNRVLGIRSVAAQTNVTAFNYRYNDANQRQAVTLEDGSYWSYEYDRLGQVTSGKRFWGDGTPVAGQQFEYAFDDIGNRTSAKTGGDGTGGGLRTASYSANSLNQYVSRTNPSDVDVIGVAKVDATVTVNGAAAYRKGEYYRASVSVTNSGTNVFQAVSNLATLGTSTDLTTGGLLVPKVNQTFAYDADGNLTNDSVFTYFWDGENRLISLTNNGAANQGFLRQTMTYDSTGRRVRLQVETNSGASFVTTRHIHFVNEDWNLVAELSATNSQVINAYLWGADLSGTMLGAGGVGGLLLVTNASNGPQIVAYDGHGNIVTLILSSGTSVCGRYEYGPFGEVTRISGDAAIENRLRYSSKYDDAEIGLHYYSLRYYNPGAGSWNQRDLLAEQGGANLYGFVRNAPTVFVDLLGLVEIKSPSAKFKVKQDLFGMGIDVEVDISGKISRKTRCCKGVGNVDDTEVSINGTVKAGISVKTFAGKWSPPGYPDTYVDYYFGAATAPSVSGSISGKILSNKCKGVDLSGQACFKVGGGGNISVGGKGTVKLNNVFYYDLSAQLVAAYGISVERCYVCQRGSCNWGALKVCGEASLTGELGLLTKTFIWDLGKGKTCWSMDENGTWTSQSQ